MNNISHFIRLSLMTLISSIHLLLLTPLAVDAQDFDFSKLGAKISEFTVVVKVHVEYSFGMQTNEAQQRVLGAVVSDDGMIIFDGSFLSESNPFIPMNGFSFKSTPTAIEIFSLDGDEYKADYMGVDRFTGIGFVKLLDEKHPFKPVKFVSGKKNKVGDWLGLYMLLPEFVEPPLAADVGMVANLIEAPEKFTLTIGFSPLEMTSVLFDDNLDPVGVLGGLSDPSASPDAAGLMESFGQFDLPLLGIISADKLADLIANPPQKGKIDRAWLGITLQALTKDIAEFLEINTPGGIIVNEVVRNSPAERAGLLVGDVIYKMNSQAIEIDKEEKVSIFQRKVSQMGAGTKVEFSIFRPSEIGLDSLRILAVLDAAPMAASDADEYEDETLEFKARDLVFADYLLFNREQGALKGVVVSKLDEGGPAFMGGLQIGDVIQRVDGNDISSVEELSEAMNVTGDNKPSEVVFFIWRHNKTMFINIKAEWGS